MTVWCVDGFWFKGYLGDVGIVKSLPGEKVSLDYDNRNPSEPNIASAAASLRDRLADGDVCVGVSMGAQVCARMLRDAGTTKIAEQVILLANPEQKFTGRVKTPQYGGLGVPIDTGTEVVSLAAQWDYWADIATGIPWWSWTNLWYSMRANTVHTTGYFNLDPTLPYPSIREGNIAHMWAPGTDKWLRDNVERYCHRPVTL